jgi:excisionase family DNA binding protein
VAEAADYLRCSKQRVYDLTASGRLPVSKDGTRSLFRREWLDAYLTPPPAVEDAP